MRLCPCVPAVSRALPRPCSTAALHGSAPAAGRHRGECQHHASPTTTLQSTARRSASAQKEMEFSRSPSPRPARRQYLS